MRLRFVLVCMSLACSLGAHAEVSCPGIYDRGFNEDTYYVLAFVGGASLEAAEARNRQSRRAQLESNITPKLQDYVYRLTQPISSSAPTVILLTCDFPMRPSDLDREDLSTLSKRNVLATLWAGTEEERASVVYVSLPHYERRPGRRREVEVAWLRVAATADELDDWSKEFGRNSATQQAMLAMAVGFVAIKQANWPLAKLSLCQVRSNLKLVTQEAVRPKPAELQKDMERLIKEAMDQVDKAAALKSIDLNAIAPIKLACSA